MPPKPQVFKTPDGKEFSSKAEWRDYMVLTFYSFKDKSDEQTPLIKLPGSIGGQMFDIADCKNCTMIIMDQTEQVQIDDVSNCKILVGACASSIFIRNCKNCVFYTCCRQLRLRDVTDCKFYIYSMAEVHIEYSSRVFFAPFNGGYPEHLEHLKAANLEVNRNLWYDIYDHNDPNKSHLNWGLIPEAEYEEPWFPNGICEPAVPRTVPGSVIIPQSDQHMQSFSLQKMMEDAKQENIPLEGQKSDVSAVPPPPPAKDEVRGVVEELLQTVFSSGKMLENIIPNISLIGLNGKQVSSKEAQNELVNAQQKSVVSIQSYYFSSDGHMLFVSFLLMNTSGEMENSTAIFIKHDKAFKLAHLHQSVAL